MRRFAREAALSAALLWALGACIRPEPAPKVLLLPTARVSAPPARPAAGPAPPGSTRPAPRPWPDTLKPIVARLSVAHAFPWQAIVIHHSATLSGSAAEFDAAHRKKGWQGLGYDFVIGNGRGSGDGEIEVGFRWDAQMQGAHAGNEYYNRYGIGICLVGNFERGDPTAAQNRSLQDLCRFLTRKFRIAPDRIVGHREARRGTLCPGRHFPLEALRGELERMP